MSDYYHLDCLSNELDPFTVELEEWADAFDDRGEADVAKAMREASAVLNVALEQVNAKRRQFAGC